MMSNIDPYVFLIIERITENYSIGTQDGRDYCIDWEIVQHPDNCDDNTDGEKLGGIVEEKSARNRSCYLLNNYDLVFHIWDVFICICQIDSGSPWHVIVDNSL